MRKEVRVIAKSVSLFILYIYIYAHTHVKHARARILFIILILYDSILARQDFHVLTNETFTKYKLFISLSSMAAPLVSKKTGVDMSYILSYNKHVLQNIVIKINHCVKPEFREITHRKGVQWKEK